MNILRFNQHQTSDKPTSPLLANPDLCRALTGASLLVTDALALPVITHGGGNTNLPKLSQTTSLGGLEGTSWRFCSSPSNLLATFPWPVEEHAIFASVTAWQDRDWLPRRHVVPETTQNPDVWCNFGDMKLTMFTTRVVVSTDATESLPRR